MATSLLDPDELFAALLELPEERTKAVDRALAGWREPLKPPQIVDNILIIELVMD